MKRRNFIFSIITLPFFKNYDFFHLINNSNFNKNIYIRIKDKFKQLNLSDKNIYNLIHLYDNTSKNYIKSVPKIDLNHLTGHEKFIKYIKNNNTYENNEELKLISINGWFYSEIELQAKVLSYLLLKEYQR